MVLDNLPIIYTKAILSHSMNVNMLGCPAQQNLRPSSGESTGRCLPDPENSRPPCRCCLERASHQVSRDENKDQDNFIWYVYVTVRYLDLSSSFYTQFSNTAVLTPLQYQLPDTCFYPPPSLGETLSLCYLCSQVGV